MRKLTSKDDEDGVGNHEEETHLGFEYTAVATSAELGEGVGDVAGNERPAKGKGQRGTRPWTTATHMRMEAMRGDKLTSPVWEAVKP